MPHLTHDNPQAMNDLEAVLADQQDITSTLTAMLGRQRQLVEAGDGESLLTLLSERQRLVDRLIASQEALGELLAVTERVLPGVNDERKSRIEAALGTISARLAEIMESDRVDQESIERSRKRVRDEITTLDANQKANAAYGRNHDKHNRYADHKG